MSARCAPQAAAASFRRARLSACRSSALCSLRPLLPGHGLRRSVGLFLRSVQRLVVGLHLSAQRRRALALHQRAAISFLRLKSTAGKFVVQCFAGGGFFFRQGAALLFSFRAALSGQRSVGRRAV